MIYRIDVRAEGPDPAGTALRQQIREFGAEVASIATRRIFLIDTDAPPSQVRRIADELLADPIVEHADFADGGAAGDSDASRIEIHLKPGVMDPVAASTEMAIRDMGLPVNAVRTGRAYLLSPKLPAEKLDYIANRVLANGVIESVHFDRYIPQSFPAGHEYRFNLKHIPLRDLSSDQLTKLSRDGHLFLSLAEMQAIQKYFRGQEREPTDVELETIAQTWSEHCVHKTLKSAVEVVDESGKVLRRYNNLIKDTIFNSTKELMNRVSGFGDRVSGESPNQNPNPDTRTPNPEPFCLSVFKDNAGVIVFDETDAVCFKVETHNHPSAIEPYGGSATGIGGCIRDIMGTGLGAKPIANTDIFCVAFPEYGKGGLRTEDSGLSKDPNSVLSPQHSVLPKGIIHPKRVLQQVVAGVRDYGNRMGIPTVNGAVYFDNRYVGNPLVFCGCAGLIPRDKVTKEVKPGDAIVVMGGRTGRDGIHGATFSSAELTDTHADEFSHAVQIGNAITQKTVADVILQARDRNLFTAITDCGAGGLSSAIGEMGEHTGAAVELDKVPLKYAGLRYDEIWISEAQERMVLSVPPKHVAEILELAASENVEATVIGTFGTPGSDLILNYNGNEVGRLSMKFLHEGLPSSTRKAIVNDSGTGALPVQQQKDQHGRGARATDNVKDNLLQLLAHPNIASKHWIIRQYDHEVQGGSVIKPLTGPLQIGPSDAAVVRPKLTSMRGIALACGFAPHIEDSYQMAIAAIDEAVRNVVAVGADPNQIAILDNFCWPSVDDERTMGTLVRACEACRDAALAYNIPFISGKDSLHNQFTNKETGQVIRIPNTLLISAIAVIDDVRKCVTMDLKRPASSLWRMLSRHGADLRSLAGVHRAVAEWIASGIVLSCHDVSEGGTLVAVAEMAIASGLGVELKGTVEQTPFDELIGSYIFEIDAAREREFIANGKFWASFQRIGTVTADRTFKYGNTFEASIDELTAAWRGTLDW